ncbi:protein ROS1A-like [Cornus florida]|uniref:protein ROS1A-like n=1 Tax=Cornus florida TaxID=4283 RepID=UPI00289B1CAF|nr:protein ROS1A-like [Cornus florida]
MEELGNSMERVLEKQGVWTPVTPQKFYLSRPPEPISGDRAAGNWVQPVVFNAVTSMDTNRGLYTSALAAKQGTVPEEEGIVCGNSSIDGPKLCNWDELTFMELMVLANNTQLISESAFDDGGIANNNNQSSLFGDHTYANHPPIQKDDRADQEGGKDEIDNRADQEEGKDEMQREGENSQSTPTHRKRHHSDIDSNKKSTQRPKRKKYWPKIAVEGKARKAPKSHKPASSTPTPKTPKTPKQPTPKRATLKKSNNARKKNLKVSVTPGKEHANPLEHSAKEAAIDQNPPEHDAKEPAIDDAKTAEAVDQNPLQHDAKIAEAIDQNPLEHSAKCAEAIHAPKSCRRVLNFILEAHGRQNNDSTKRNVITEQNSLLVYRRVFQANKCERNSKLIGPNFPRIFKKRRMEIEKSILHWGEGITVRRRGFVKFLPTQFQRTQAFSDPESFWCIFSLIPAVKSKYKQRRSHRLKGIDNIRMEVQDNIVEIGKNEQPVEGQNNMVTSHESPVDIVQRLGLDTPSSQSVTRSEVKSSEVHHSMVLVQGPESVTRSEVKSSVVQRPAPKVTPKKKKVQRLDLVTTKRLIQRLELATPTHTGLEYGNNIDDITRRLKDVCINDEGCRQLVVHHQNAPCRQLVVDHQNAPYRQLVVHQQNAQCCQLVVHQQNTHPEREQSGALVPREQSGALVPLKKRKSQPKVDLDAESMRVWKLLTDNDGSHEEEEHDKDKKKWWEKQREVFRGRVDSFINRLNHIQGNRKFSQWKGSVVDSVVGVFLTQNVSDHLSSSAFMSLAARFPLRSTSNHTVCNLQEAAEETWNENGKQSPSLRQSKETIGTTRPISGEGEVNKVVKDKSAIQNFDSLTGGNLSATFMPSNNETSCCKLDKHSCDGTGIDDGNRMENQKKGLSLSDNVFDLEGAYVSGHLPGSKVPLAPSNMEIDSPGLLGGFENINMKETGDTYASLDKCQLPGESSFQTEVGKEKILHSSNNRQGNNKMILQPETTLRTKKSKVAEKQENPINWDDLRKTYSSSREPTPTGDAMDSLDWEAVRKAPVEVVAQTILDRGMNNVLAVRIKEFLDRVARDHGSLNLEWLRNVPSQKAKDYLLSIEGLGLKSVECIRLLSLRHHAFPVDTNVCRVAVRLGWVPLQPLPGDLQIHLLEQYPMLDAVQKYLWPRLCKLDRLKLYELHYQMITFGKIFCTKKNPNCHACPMRGECKHFASAFASSRLALPGLQETGRGNPGVPDAYAPNPVVGITPITGSLPEENLPDSRYQSNDCEPIIEMPDSPGPVDTETLERDIGDIEDLFTESDDKIPTVNLNEEEFKSNLMDYIEKNNIPISEEDMSKALVLLSSEAASMPAPKIMKYIARLKTLHNVYTIPDDHVLLEGLEKRDPDDPSPYLLAVWTPEFGARTVQEIFAKGFICVRGFNRKTRYPTPIPRKFHISASEVAKRKTKKTRKSRKTRDSSTANP